MSSQVTLAQSDTISFSINSTKRGSTPLSDSSPGFWSSDAAASSGLLALFSFPSAIKILAAREKAQRRVRC
jgi:hypothetical protein